MAKQLAREAGSEATVEQLLWLGDLEARVLCGPPALPAGGGPLPDPFGRGHRRRGDLGPLWRGVGGEAQALAAEGTSGRERALTSCGKPKTWLDRQGLAVP